MPDPGCCYREQLTYMLYSKFREPKLFRMAVSGDWEGIPARCQAYPREAAFVHKYAPNDTALHRILRRDNSCHAVDENSLEQMVEIKLEAVEALLQCSRQAVTHCDSFGRAPLHLSCMDSSRCGVKATHLLLQRMPERELESLLLRKDIEGRTPLHWLLLRHDQIPLELLDLILQLCPAVLMITDALKETPLDIVKRRGQKIINHDEVWQRIAAALPPESLARPHPKVVGLKDLPLADASAFETA